ncbi:MAG: glycosyltransferase [Myxococcota bacterium]
MSDPLVSVLVIARDAASTLPSLLNALQPLQQQLSEVEIVVQIDDRTRDQTEVWARRAGARVIHDTFDGFGAFKERGRRRCCGAWVLNLDADERPDPQVLSAVARVVCGPWSHAWMLDIRTSIGGRPTRWGPFAAERRLRLFPRVLGHWDCSEQVHETPCVSVPIGGTLPGTVDHRSFLDAWDCLARHERYGIRAARQRSSPAQPWTAWTRASLRAMRHTIVHGGLVAGPSGIILAWGQARATYLKWARTADDAHEPQTV